MNSLAWKRWGPTAILTLCFAIHHAVGAGLTVGPGQITQLGVAGTTTTHVYDFVTIQSGGQLEIFGNVTLTVAGNVVIDGEILSLPTAKQATGEPGVDGDPGLDNQPTGQNVGTGGTLGGTGTNWIIVASSLTINSQGNVFVNGSIQLTPKLDGGDGGRGGHGGHGGTGMASAPGAGGGGGSQAGQGGQGGLGGLVGTLRIFGDHIELAEDGLILLENRSVGGTGGRGGDGGIGGRGGNGTEATSGGRGGLGGLPGGGGTGGGGRPGGSVTLRADTLHLYGTISVSGGAGGDGGPAGAPGHGGDGGHAGPGENPQKRGGDGGHAGAWGSTGFTGGRGGNGSNGGSVFLDAPVLINEAVINVAGGAGGQGGDGWEAAAAVGGMGGTPGGVVGFDSVAIPPGQDGVAGPAGAVHIRNPWVFLPGSRFVSGSPWWRLSDAGGAAPSPGSGGGSGGVVLRTDSVPLQVSASVNTTTTRAFELSLKCRWLTAAGSLDVTLAGVNLLHLDAPTTLPAGVVELRLLVSDPAVLNQGFRDLVLQLNPGSPAQIEILELAVVNGSDRLFFQVVGTPPSQFELRWFGATGLEYQLQERTFNPGSDWDDVGGLVAGEDSLITVNRPIEASPARRFYRLVITPQ